MNVDGATNSQQISGDVTNAGESHATNIASMAGHKVTTTLEASPQVQQEPPVVSEALPDTTSAQPKPMTSQSPTLQLSKTPEPQSADDKKTEEALTNEEADALREEMTTTVFQMAHLQASTTPGYPIISGATARQCLMMSSAKPVLIKSLNLQNELIIVTENKQHMP